MIPLDFISFQETPGEKSLGIATVKYLGKIILRYKVVASKSGQGYFLSPASYSMPATQELPARYEPAFMIDSLSEKELCENLIRKNVNDYFARKKKPSPQSAFEDHAFNGIPF